VITASGFSGVITSHPKKPEFEAFVGKQCLP